MFRILTLSLTIATFAFAAGAPVAVAQTLPNTPEGPLSDTEWHLVSFKPADSAKPTFSPPKGVKYTMVLATKGRATFRYDCNTARGIWSSVDPADGKGSLTFGPLAMTRKACASSAFNADISNDIRDTLAYDLDGSLLSVTTARGTYVWHRVD